MKKTVTRAVIPAAGLGTRFLPATKALPKELLPIVDKPTIEYIVDEAIEAGIRDILIIISSTKDAIIKHFAKNRKLERELIDRGKIEYAKRIKNIAIKANIYFVYQHKQKGLGHAVACAKHFAKDEPFALLLGDDMVQKSHPKDETAIKQCINAFKQTNATILGVQQVKHADVSKYGIISPSSFDKKDKRLCLLRGIIEKPSVAEAPSDLAVCGRYILKPSIFEYLKFTKPGHGGEIQLTDAIMRAIMFERVYAYNFKGVRYDIGSKLGFVIASIDYALKDKEIASLVLTHIRECVKAK
jgi:UTP--glucose-1-phosphate uridylyltransferase